ECIDRAVRAVRRATEHADEVEFSAQDATRTDIHYLVTMYQEAARAGARIVNIPDTVGYAQPEEFAKTVLAVRGALATYNGGLRVSVHCHNDLGLAVANTLAAVEAGADQAEVCMNGIGERGGNAALEEVVMAPRSKATRSIARTASPWRRGRTCASSTTACSSVSPRAPGAPPRARCSSARSPRAISVKVAYQGAPGAYSESAAATMFPDEERV